MWPEMTLKPVTEDEIKEVQTIDGIRRRLREYSRQDSLTHNVMMDAQYRGLSGEDTMTLLAYHALLKAEELQAMVLEFHATTIRPMIRERGNTTPPRPNEKEM